MMDGYAQLLADDEKFSLRENQKFFLFKFNKKTTDVMPHMVALHI